jgi:hypothetical protein
MLTAYYDLAVSPATYDIVAFLSHAERVRRDAGEDNLRIVMLPGPVNGFRADRLWPHSLTERIRMRDRVALPMARMLPRAEVTLLANRPPEARRPADAIGWGQRLYGLRRHVAALAVGVRPLRLREDCRAGLAGGPARNIVTITLREAEHWPERNSNLDAWHAAACAIRAMGYLVMVVRDTRQAGARFGEFASPATASIDLEARAQLYRSAALNLFVNNGPAWFAVALDVPVMIFKMVAAGGPTCTAAYFAGCGLPVGSQLPGADHQRIVWADDTENEIVAAFRQWEAGRRRRAAS